jgi:chromate transporter
LYVVSVGYFVAGVPGAICGWLAMITPALFIMPLLYFVGRAIDHPRISAVLQSIVIASAGLLLASAVPLARSGLTDPVTWGIALASLALLFGTKLDTLWIVLGGAAAALTARGLLLLAALG